MIGSEEDSDSEVVKDMGVKDVASADCTMNNYHFFANIWGVTYL